MAKKNKFRTAHIYSSSLYEVADERNQTKDTLDELLTLKSIMDENPDIMKAFSTNKISNSDKQKLLDTMIKDCSELTQDFMNLLFEYGRLNIFDLITEDYQKIYNDSNGIIRAKVVTAYNMTDDQQQSMKDAIAKRMDAKEVDLNTEVDESVIGGAKVFANDTIVDGTIQSKINKIKKLLITN